MGDLVRRKAMNAGRRHGLSAVELLVILAIGTLFVLFLLMMLPRSRESARMASCRRNLMQIGVALSLYDQSVGFLPSVPLPEGEAAVTGSGPLLALLEELGLSDFAALTDARSRPSRRTGLLHEVRRVPGFLCASDPHATGGTFPAPVNYRATTGDAPDGGNGAFAPGRKVSIAQIEAIDGSGYTAAFSERLVGDNVPEHPSSSNYALVPGPLPATGCPKAGPTAWRGDAGASWGVSEWRTTLYNHALLPDAGPSCIADDRAGAFMGASSGHAEGVNVLLLDGGVRTFTPQVDPKVWRAWANIPPAPRTATEGPLPATPSPEPATDPKN